MGLTDTVRAVLDHKGIGVCAVMPETPVYEALEIMADKDIGAVLVMEDADLCGIFSGTRLRAQGYFAGQGLARHHRW